MCDEIPRAAIEAAHQAWTLRMEAPMPSETHRLTLDDEPPRTAERDDPDGPPEPMMPAFWHNAEACMALDAEKQRAYDRDAALIAAIAKLWGYR